MDLRTRISTALKAAMKEKQPERLSTLRLISAAIKDRDIAARGTEEAGSTGVSDAEVRQILARMIKQRQESARAYEEGGRLELAEKERDEIGVIEGFLPRKLNDRDAGKAVDAAIRETGASSIRDMGRVMGYLKERHAGQMDFGTVSSIVKARLG